MAQRALVFGHADGDGHLAAVQTRENLLNSDIGVSDVVVDPKITRNWKFWENQFQSYDFGCADLVVVVDIMLSAHNPLRSYEALVSRVTSESHRQFLIVDHHPVDRLPKLPTNLRIRLVTSVYECCYGDPSDLMLIASICDKDERPVKSRLTDLHRKRARGINRAVSDRAGLAGKLTLQLISDRAWQVFEELADEPAGFHRTIYGNRIDRIATSPILQVARAARAVE